MFSLLVFKNNLYLSFVFDTEIKELNEFDIVVEIMFGIDMIMRFFHEYIDSVSLDVVHDIELIIKHYLK